MGVGSLDAADGWTAGRSLCDDRRADGGGEAASFRVAPARGVPRGPDGRRGAAHGGQLERVLAERLGARAPGLPPFRAAAPPVRRLLPRARPAASSPRRRAAAGGPGGRGRDGRGVRAAPHAGGGAARVPAAGAATAAAAAAGTRVPEGARCRVCCVFRVPRLSSICDTVRTADRRCESVLPCCRTART